MSDHLMPSAVEEEMANLGQLQEEEMANLGQLQAFFPGDAEIPWATSGLPQAANNEEG